VGGNSGQSQTELATKPLWHTLTSETTDGKEDSWDGNHFILLLDLVMRMYKGSTPISRSNLHMDILLGRDESLDVSDFFGGGKCTIIASNASCKQVMLGVEMDLPVDPYGEMERSQLGR
jgi:hypothetical protein